MRTIACIAPEIPPIDGKGDPWHSGIDSVRDAGLHHLRIRTSSGPQEFYDQIRGGDL